MNEDKPPKPTREFLVNQIARSSIDIERADAVKKFCQFMLEKKIYVENDLKEG